jgi:hypothetical protein
MKRILHDHLELLVYAILWFFLFLTPVVSLYIQEAHDGTSVFEWSLVFAVWQQFLVFFVAFLIHNFFMAPMLIFRHRQVAYISSVVALMALFVLIQCSQRPAERPLPQNEMADHRPPMPFEHEEMPDDLSPHREGPMGREYRPEGLPPLIYGQHDVVATIVLFLMLGVNLGVKHYFYQRRNQQRIAQLEKENLEQQLEYLKYQINPHFLMNTLNNIHALVDIDQEKAKQTILELSKILRYLLYEGAKQKVPLNRELDFLKNYIQLMSLRYSSKVEIRVSIPDQLPDSEIPPLMLITFVENAFKHGVSYRQQSFIDIKVEAGEKLHFYCQNSKVPKTDDQHGGVGLQNVRRRLELLYSDSYQLDIDDATDVYTVRLSFPL